MTTITRKLQQSVYFILKHNRDGSQQTQACRKRRLFQMCRDLVQGGYQLRNIRSLRYKHIVRLIQHWKSSGLSAGTIKNRMTDVRWICEKIGKQNMVPSNSQLGIEKRVYVGNKNKAIMVDKAQLEKISSEHVRYSLRLQEAFGLRREESLKIRIFQADVGDTLRLQGSWCKNGRPRDVPIRTDEQRALLDEIKNFLGERGLSLIPTGKTYYQHLKVYENQLHRAGISKAHGLRHAYAQRRFQEIAGFRCPAMGGPVWQDVTDDAKSRDRQARLVVSQELGHGRMDITRVYLNVGHGGQDE